MTRTYTIFTPVSPTKKRHGNFRKRINKDALAAYFDKNARNTLQDWQNTVVAELDAADNPAHKNQFDLQQDIEQRYALFDIVRDFDYTDATMDEVNAVNITNIEIVTMPQSVIEQFETIAKHFSAQPQTQMPNSVQSKQERMSMAPETNKFITDRFVHKYHGANTSVAMCVFEKQKRHSTKIAYIMHQLQITK